MINRDKPAHMTDKMEDCLGRLLGLTEAVNRLFGQYQGSTMPVSGRAVVHDPWGRSPPGRVDTSTALLAAELIEDLDEGCPYEHLGFDMWAITDLHRTLERMVHEHPTGEEIPFEDIQQIQIDMRVFAQEFIRNLV